jgi:N-acetylglutamate synthase/N-acetylornithine aminotransferase
MQCEVTGAATQEDAQAIAKSVVGSSLVKAAVHGHDPNWGRIAAAVGYAQVRDTTPKQSEALSRASEQAQASSR